jgi:hypothetical protein
LPEVAACAGVSIAVDAPPCIAVVPAVGEVASGGFVPPQAASAITAGQARKIVE